MAGRLLVLFMLFSLVLMATNGSLMKTKHDVEDSGVQDEEMRTQQRRVAFSGFPPSRYGPIGK